MPFTLHPFAVLRGDYVLRFQHDESAADGETVLPVVADPDPPLGPNERIWGPEYEVLSDRVRAYGRAVAMTPEEIAEQYATIPKLTFSQLLIGLVAEQWITEDEGEAWLVGTLPASVTALIATLPAEQQFPAKARASRPTIILRTDPLVIALGASQGKTPEELDTFFAFYSHV